MKSRCGSPHCNAILSAAVDHDHLSCSHWYKIQVCRWIHTHTHTCNRNMNTSQWVYAYQIVLTHGIVNDQSLTTWDEYVCTWIKHTYYVYFYYSSICTHAHTCMHARTHAHAYTHTRTHTHTHTHTNTHTHTYSSTLRGKEIPQLNFLQERGQKLVHTCTCISQYTCTLWYCITFSTRKTTVHVL